MISNESPRVYLQPTADGCDTLYSPRYGQTYHSTHGALAEAEHVFLQATGVGQRLAAGLASQVLEVGFGTGLNFWLTMQRSLAGRAALRYVALEKNLLPAGWLAELNHGHVLGPVESARQDFLAWRAGLGEAVPEGSLDWAGGQGTRLTLLIGEATKTELPPEHYHAVYHDAFSPDANPELWTPDFLARLYGCLLPGGKLATYSAKGAVRRALQAAGFQVEKQPGPPGKREMLVAVRLGA